MKERPIWISVCIILLFVLYVTYRNGRQANLRAVDAERHTYAAFQKQEELKQQIRLFQSQIQSIQAQPQPEPQPAPSSQETEDDLDGMKDKGLKEPARDLVADLRKHPELIPYSGALGGTVGFSDPKGIRILNAHWAVAYFEDGHFSGKLLLKYEVSDNGKIAWKVLDSYVD